MIPTSVLHRDEGSSQVKGKDAIGDENSRRKCKGTCNTMWKLGVQRGEALQGETPQKCVQYASIPVAQSKQINRDKGNREKQHNYVNELP
eukprot:11147240-Heterocapsa_arctica.AAC.1